MFKLCLVPKMLFLIVFFLLTGLLELLYLVASEILTWLKKFTAKPERLALCVLLTTLFQGKILSNMVTVDFDLFSL